MIWFVLWMQLLFYLWFRSNTSFLWLYFYVMLVQWRWNYVLTDCWFENELEIFLGIGKCLIHFLSLTFVMQALPIYLDKIFHPFVAVLLSVTFVLAFGEVIATLCFEGWGVLTVAMLAWNDPNLWSYNVLDHSTSHMFQIWTRCWGKFCVVSANFDDHLLSHCLPNWKGKSPA